MTIANTITETMSITTTSLVTFTEMATGNATTEISFITTTETLPTTEVQHSYGTITITTYMYVESNSSSEQLANATNAANPLGQLSLFLQVHRFTVNPSDPSTFVPVAIVGAAFAVGASILMRRRKRGNKKGPEENSTGIGPGQIDGRVLDYIASHQGAISMGQATEDLGISAKDLTGAIEKLKAEGRLKAT
jgi:hypothetical protein